MCLQWRGLLEGLRGKVTSIGSRQPPVILMGILLGV